MDENNPNTPVLEAAGLEVKSEWTRRVQITGLDWKVMSGESWVIGGRRGSGKTDLLMTVAGLHRPDVGSVRLFGRETTNLSEEELLKQRTRIGFVFKEGGRMFSGLTVAENVALPLCYHRNWPVEKALSEVHAILEVTELADLARETAQSLGPGWRQRVGLARALALKPSILFLDEPASSMELDHHDWARRMQENLRKQNVTVIATTNDYTLWDGVKHHYAMIKDKHLEILGESAHRPEMEFRTIFLTKK